MAYMTPRNAGRTAHTPRMSERKRSLFPSTPAPAPASPCSPNSSSSSCDLGLLSPLDSSGEEAPDTPNSWRSTRNSSRKEALRRVTRQAVKGILKSPLNLKNYMLRHRGADEDIRHPFPDADTESCSSSLKDLTFRNDSDSSDCKENQKRTTAHTRSFANCDNSRKSQRIKNKTTNTCFTSPVPLRTLHVQLSPLKMLNQHAEHKSSIKSPTGMLKTPNDGVSIADESPPRIYHSRRSIIDTNTSSPLELMSPETKKRGRETNSPSSVRNKHPRLENAPAPKARLSLFNTGSDKIHQVSVKSFYPKSNANLNTSFISDISKICPTWNAKNVAIKKRHSVRRRAEARRRIGQMNFGVRHGIRRPKPSKNFSVVSKADALKLALNIIENSPLNDYINEFMTMKSKPSNVKSATVTDTQISNGTGISQNQLQKMDSILKSFGLQSSLNSVLNNGSSFTDIIVQKEALTNNVNADNIRDNDFEDKEINSCVNNKFFKSSRRAADARKAIVKLANNVKVQMKNGKLCLPKRRDKELDGSSVHQQLSMIQSIVQFDTSDLMNDDSDEDEQVQYSNPINALLNQWREEEVPPTEPQVLKPLQSVCQQIQNAENLVHFNRTSENVQKFNQNRDDFNKENSNTPQDNFNNCSLQQTHVSDRDNVLCNTNNVAMSTNNVLDNNNSLRDANIVVNPNVTIEFIDNVAVSQVGDSEDNSVGNVIPQSWKSSSSGEGSTPRVYEGPGASCIDMDQGHSNSSDVYSSECGVQFLPSEGGYIIVEDSEMPDDLGEDCDLEKIEAELNDLNSKISEMARMNNINPALVLQVNDVSHSCDKDVSISNTGIIPVGSYSPQRHSSAPESDRESSCDGTTTPATAKLFPVFLKDAVRDRQAVINDVNKTRTPTGSKKKLRSIGSDQYLIDAGQKKLGATQCNECGVIYQVGDAEDENDHMTHHMATDILKFNGWKNERLCGRWGQGRALVVGPGDSPAHWQRVNELLQRVVHPQLGYAASLAPNKIYKVYLYVEGKQLVGCLVAEALQQAHRLLTTGDLDCCSTEAYPVKCGISRIWTHTSHRRRGVATSLVNCMRANFVFGHILACEELAFSSPTQAGREFAHKYTRTENFLVYLD